MDTSSLISLVRRHLPEGAPPDPAGLREALAGRLTDPRSPRGIRHRLVSLLLVLVTGVACGHRGALAVAQAASGWDQDLLAEHGCWTCPATGLRVPPPASALDRLPRLLDPDEAEAALSSCLAAAALDPAVTARAAEEHATQLRDRQQRASRRKRRPAAEALRENREDGWFRAAPGHPWLDPAVTGDPGHVAARHGVAVDGKERKNAKTAGNKKVHLLAAITHVPGIVVSQDRVAKDGKANEVSHFRPVLEHLPLADAVVTSDAMQTTRGNARFLRQDKHAHYLFPVLGNQPHLYEQLDALDWENTPVAAATSEITRGRIETRALRVLPAPEGTGFAGAARAILIERHVTEKKDGDWVMRNCEAVLYITSLADDDATAEDLLAHIRGHWRIEHAHWLRDTIWNEDKSLIRTGSAPQIWSALANLVISLFRIHAVTRYTEETRLNAGNPRRALRLLDLAAT